MDLLHIVSMVALEFTQAIAAKFLKNRARQLEGDHRFADDPGGRHGRYIGALDRGHHGTLRIDFH